MKILPDGFHMEGSNNIKDFSRKIKEFAQNVEKDGKLIGIKK